VASSARCSDLKLQKQGLAAKAAKNAKKKKLI
jgi:hypothetical protein